MARRSILEQEEGASIDLSSMIDCIFILLIFFIVTTTFVEEKGLQLNKPDAAASSLMQKKKNVILEITAQNEVLFDDRQIDMADVAGFVKSGLESPDEPVIIRVSEKSRHGTLVSVWDAARRGGAQMLSFTTVN